MLKNNKIGFICFIIFLSWSVISTLERVYWFNTANDSQGAIRRNLIPEVGFGSEQNGMVYFKIKKGEIFYKWSVFDQYDCGMWPFVRKAESKNIPDFIKSHILNVYEPPSIPEKVAPGKILIPKGSMVYGTEDSGKIHLDSVKLKNGNKYKINENSKR